MLTNFHSHTTFCDGKNTAEEMVLAAIEKGFDVFGFSGHGYTEFHQAYCMQDTEGYRAEILRLKEKYKKDIQIYLGTEEDIYQPANRADYDYIISSSHYAKRNGCYAPIDSSPETLKSAIELFDGDLHALAESYYSNFVEYIKARRPDIIGHFDLLTKFDEKRGPYFLGDPVYQGIAEKYLREALSADCIFEVNTGAISRQWRTAPYPHESLLRIILKEGGRLTVTADTHNRDTIDCHFAESKKMLRDIGFRHLYTLYNNEWIKYEI